MKNKNKDKDKNRKIKSRIKIGKDENLEIVMIKEDIIAQMRKKIGIVAEKDHDHEIGETNRMIVIENKRELKREKNSKKNIKKNNVREKKTKINKDKDKGRGKDKDQDPEKNKNN